MKEWICESERLMVRLRIDGRWVTLAQVYAPTDDSRDEIKDSFNKSLEEMLVFVAKHDHLVLMGDFHATVGRDVTTWGEVIDRHGEAAMNGNGQRLLRLCAMNELVVLNTFYQHKDIHKFTWESKGRGLKSVIDYFIMRKVLRPGVADVKVIRGAEAGSDHYLVLMRVNLKVRKPTHEEVTQPN